MYQNAVRKLLLCVINSFSRPVNFVTVFLYNLWTSSTAIFNFSCCLNCLNYDFFKRFYHHIAYQINFKSCLVIVHNNSCIGSMCSCFKIGKLVLLFIYISNTFPILLWCTKLSYRHTECNTDVYIHILFTRHVMWRLFYSFMRKIAATKPNNLVHINLEFLFLIHFKNYEYLGFSRVS